MISNDLVTTFNIPTDRIQLFVFNSATVDNPEAKAKEFCHINKMKFLGLKVMEPYSLHVWQHNKAIAFEVECSNKTSQFYYEYGKVYY